ncbi:putative leader peptide [Modestobacter sp. KNN46-3]|nr:putative leader peptide [Modestobacter sp. KNN46-3]
MTTTASTGGLPTRLPSTLPGAFLVSRLHVDLLRVSTAACPAR